MGTLDYFALRSDKQAFLERDGLVAYAIYGGICLVSPDPICAPEERDELWSAFRRYADDHGWSVAVLGAGEEWLGAYRRSGMHERYIGDEGVVDVRTFSLEGGSRKGLRQAVNRIAKYGYDDLFPRPGPHGPGPRRSGTGDHGEKPPGRGGTRVLDDPRAHLRPP